MDNRFPRRQPLYTLGHSNRSIDELIALLVQHGIRLLIDIRRYPGSRNHPQFNRGCLSASLEALRIEYEWMEALGGMRNETMNEHSPNTGLSDPAFRNYADYMLTQPFQVAARAVMRQASIRATALLCAEKSYLHCHRRLLCDYLSIQGVPVVHLVDAMSAAGHILHPNLVVNRENQPIYPLPLFDSL